MIETKIVIENAAVGDDITIKQNDKVIFTGKVTEDILKDGIIVTIEQPEDNSDIEVSATITDSDGQEYEASDSASILRPPTVEIVTDENNDEFISKEELNDDTDSSKDGNIDIKVSLDKSSKEGDTVTVEVRDDKGNLLTEETKTLTKDDIDNGSFDVVYKPTSSDDIGSIEVTATIERGENSASNSDNASLDNSKIAELFESHLENGSNESKEGYSSATGTLEDFMPYSSITPNVDSFDLPTITSNGTTITWKFDEYSGTLTGSAGESEVIEIAFDKISTVYTGKYEVKLHAPIDHPEDSDLSSFEIGIPVGTSPTKGKLTIEIMDDKPTANNTELSVSEKDLALNPEIDEFIGIPEVSDSVNQFFKPGADNSATVQWAENSLDNLNDRNITTEDGQNITWIELEGAFIGTTLTEEEFYAAYEDDDMTAIFNSLVMQIFLSEEGEASVLFHKPIKHNSNIENLELSYIVTDKDGDSSEGKLSINIEDYVKVNPPKVEIVDDSDNNSYLSDEELNDSNPDEVTIKITLDKDSTKPGDKLEITDQNNVTTTHTVTQEDIDKGNVEITRPNPGVGEKIEITVTQTGADGSDKGTGSDQAYYDKPDYPKINESDINHGGDGYSPSITAKLELESTPNEDGIKWDLENMPDLSASGIPGEAPWFSLVDPEITWSQDAETGNLTGSVEVNVDGSIKNIPAIEVSISKNEDGSFNYEVTLNLPIKHDDIDGANIERLEFPFTYEDSDGNSYTGNANVDIIDDIPNTTGDEVTLSEKDLLENPTPSFLGDADSAILENFNIEASADGSTFAWDTDSIPTLKTEDGKEVTWTIIDGLLTGHTLSQEEFTSALMNENSDVIKESLVITVVPSEDNKYSVNLHKPIKHDENTESFDIKFTVTDKDGDTVQDSISINIENYAPPKIEILEDSNNDTLLTDTELNDSNPDNITIKVTVDEASSNVGDKLTITIDGVEQEPITVTQDIIDNGYTTSYKNPDPGKGTSVSVKQESASGTNKGTGSDSAVVDSNTLPELQESDITSEEKPGYDFPTSNPATVTGTVGGGISLESNDVQKNGAFELDIDKLPEIYTHDGEKVIWEQSSAWQSDGVFTYIGYVAVGNDYDSDQRTVIEINILTNSDGIVDGKYTVNLYEGIEHDSIQGENVLTLTIPYSYKEGGVTHSGTTAVKIVDDTPTTSGELVITNIEGTPTSYFEIDFGNDGYEYTLESMNGDGYREVVNIGWDLETLNNQNLTIEGQPITWLQEGNTLIVKIGDSITTSIEGYYEDGKLYLQQKETPLSSLDIELPFSVYDGDGDKLDLSINMNEVAAYNPVFSSLDNASETPQDSIPVSPLNNTVIGTDENNVLIGNDGDDILIGGLGSDSLTGGAGDDTFTWKLEDFAYGDVDTIVDFDIDSDRLDLTELKADGYNFKVVESTSSNPEADYDILISKNDEFAPEQTHKITLNDVSESTTSAEDIMNLIESDTNSLA